MLRDPKQLSYVPSSWRRQTGLVAAMALAGLVIAGLRGPTGELLAVGQAAQPSAKAPAAAASDLRYVPADAVAVLSIRPAAIVEHGEMKTLLDKLNHLTEQLGVPLEQIEEIQVVAAQFPSPGVGPGSTMFPAELVVMRGRGPHDWNALMKRMVPEGVEATFGKFKYTKHKDSNSPRPAYSGFIPDDHTLVLAAEPLLRRMMLASVKPDAGKPSWLSGWQQVAGGHATLMVDTMAVNHLLGPELKKVPGGGPGLQAIGTLSPLWEQTQRWYAGVDVSHGVKLQSTFECATPEATERVRATAAAAVTLGRNLLEKLGDQIARAPGDEAGPALIVTDLASELLKQARFTADGNAVRLRTEAQIDVADTGIAALVPAIGAAREAARRSQSTNNLKQIGLAFHNYADVYGHFPPAVVIGKDGKTPHSWRVAILPYIEGTAIYNQYKFDEPWDSENNRKLITQMPATLRDPGDDPASAFSSYFMLTGETTIGGSKDGAKFVEITDGTSNTILAVAAKCDIPWTKPEDIVYDPAKPLPKFGGRPLPGGVKGAKGFLASFADGSVRFISDTTDESTLRALITKAGGEALKGP